MLMRNDKVLLWLKGVLKVFPHLKIDEKQRKAKRHLESSKEVQDIGSILLAAIFSLFKTNQHPALQALFATDFKFLVVPGIYYGVIEG